VNKTPYAELLSMLSRHRGVVGSFVVSERDGLSIDSNVQIGVQADAVAALAASLHRKARLACGAAGCGTSRSCAWTRNAAGSVLPAATTSCW
jgi:predicted regulator of Ras-like GTPase activity (Roadblock/LC7/MglB family)